MTKRPHKVGLCALLGVVLLVSQSFGQSAPTTPVATATPAVPYSLEPIAEIAKLKSAPNTPRTADDLKAIQARVEAVARYALPAIVNIEVSDGQGSGVIVSKDGYVLTAGHVSGEPNTRIRFRLSNGTLVSGIALGANNGVDSGMCKITTPGEYSFMPLGSTRKMSEGQWVVAMGHPGGWEEGRDPVVRLGKVLNIKLPDRKDPEWYVQTDCPLIMGDSGGPVFDLDGRVIAINSRIGRESTSNVHVPVDTFEDTWDRLAKGDQWGTTGLFARLGSGASGEDITPQVTRARATLSLQAVDDASGVMITGVRPDMASEKAGIQPQDVITRFNGQIIKTFEDLKTSLSKHAPGETVTLDLLRISNGVAKPVQVKVVLDALDK
jgi:serine protease Do